MVRVDSVATNGIAGGNPISAVGGVGRRACLLEAPFLRNVVVSILRGTLFGRVGVFETRPLGVAPFEGCTLLSVSLDVRSLLLDSEVVRGCINTGGG